ncbi:hypothetical protein ACLESD_07855 [Pyxidicoccus sp. 3LFB2]
MNRSTRNATPSPVAVPAASHARSFMEKPVPPLRESYSSLPSPAPMASPAPVSHRAAGASKTSAPPP